MGLILRTPALQAHSVLRFRQWRRVIEEYVAARRGEHPDDLLPQLVGHVSLAEAITAYEAWLKDEEADLECLLIELGTELRAFLSQSACWSGGPRQQGEDRQRVGQAKGGEG